MSTDPAPPRPSGNLGPKGGWATLRENHRLIGGAVAAVLVALFALLNLDKVKVNWILGTGHSPLILVIAVAFALGIAAGWLAATMRR